MAANIKGLTVEIGGDTTKLGKALEGVQKKSKDLSGELGQINRLLKMDPGNTDLLAQKQEVLAKAIDNTSEKLKTLKEAEKQVQKQFERGEVSEEQVRALQREIIATEKKLDSYKNAAKETKDAIRGVGDESEKTEKASSDLGKTLGSAVKTGLKAVAAVAAAAVAGLTAAAESTREFRTEMGKLDTAFTQNGFTSEQARGAYSELVGILGETDQAVEAANHLAKLTDNEKDLATWTGDILPGVFATFGASLQPEALTEAANETARVGQVCGPLADALNWAAAEGETFGVVMKANTKANEDWNKAVESATSAEDFFNLALQECSTEQERQALITQTLAGYYGEAGEAYKETNADIIAANKANDNWMQSLAGIGGAIEPLITDVKNLGANLLGEAVPGVQQLADAFRGLMNGDAGASGAFASALSGMVTGLVEKITQALPTVATVGFNIIKTLATSLLQQVPMLLTTAGQLITQLASAITTYLPVVVSKGGELLGKLGEGIKNAMPGLIDRGLDIIMGLVTSLYDAAPGLIDAGFGFIKNLVQGLMDSLPTLIEKVPEIVSKFANTLNHNVPRILKHGFDIVVQLVKGIISAIPTLVKNIPKIITAIVDVWEAFNWLSLGKKAITLLKNGITGMLGAVKTAGKSIMDGCVNAMKNLPSNLMNMGKTAASGLGKALRAGLTAVKSGASAIFNGILSYFKGLPGKMLSIGTDLVKGLWNGISNMTGWIIGKLQGFGDSVLGGIKKFFGINSPSTVMRDEVGKWLPAGIAEGVDANAKTATRSVANLSQSMLDAADVGGLSFERGLNYSTRAASAGAVGSFAADNAALLAKLDGIYERLGRLQVVLDSGATVGGLIEQIDRALATRQVRVARGV